MKKKDNKQPLISQLNRSIGNAKQLLRKIINEGENYEVHVQLNAVIGGFTKLRDDLLPDYVETDLEIKLKALLASEKLDGVHRAVLKSLKRQYKSMKPHQQARLLDSVIRHSRT